MIAALGSPLRVGFRLFGYQMIVPGEYQGPSWRNPQSYAFLDAYEQSGGRAAMGDVDIRMGETPYVHDWCVQTKCVIIKISSEELTATALLFSMRGWIKRYHPRRVLGILPNP